MSGGGRVPGTLASVKGKSSSGQFSPGRAPKKEVRSSSSSPRDACKRPWKRNSSLHVHSNINYIFLFFFVFFFQGFGLVFPPGRLVWVGLGRAPTSCRAVDLSLVCCALGISLGHPPIGSCQLPGFSAIGTIMVRLALSPLPIAQGTAVGASPTNRALAHSWRGTNPRPTNRVLAPTGPHQSYQS